MNQPLQKLDTRLSTLTSSTFRNNKKSTQKSLSLQQFLWRSERFPWKILHDPQLIPILFRCQDFSNASVQGFEYATSRNSWDTRDDFLDGNLPFWHFQYQQKHLEGHFEVHSTACIPRNKKSWSTIWDSLRLREICKSYGEWGHFKVNKWLTSWIKVRWFLLDSHHFGVGFKVSDEL